MAADLSTRNSRKALGRREQIEWIKVGRGRAVGYRRRRGKIGTWYARAFVGGASGSKYRVKAIGTADDIADADGVDCLSYSQAVDTATKWDPSARVSASNATVAHAIDRYLNYLDKHRKSGRHVRYSLEAHALPILGTIKLSDLTSSQIQSWHEAVAESDARLRTSPNADEQNVREATTPDQKRARKATANRVLSQLKAALNVAHDDGLAATKPWQRVKPFRGVEKARTRFLDRDEIDRLVNEADPSFADLLLAAVYTGCRFGELIALEARDVYSDSASIHIPRSKSGHDRHVYLNSEGLQFFEGLTAGKRPADILLTRSDGKPWTPEQQRRLLDPVCSGAEISPRIRFHDLRHTYASLYLMAGGSLPDLAKQLGHTTTRMVEKHYGHLAESYRASQAEKFAPALGRKAGKVRKLKRNR